MNWALTEACAREGGGQGDGDWSRGSARSLLLAQHSSSERPPLPRHPDEGQDPVYRASWCQAWLNPVLWTGPWPSSGWRLMGLGQQDQARPAADL